MKIINYVLIVVVFIAELLSFVSNSLGVGSCWSDRNHTACAFHVRASMLLFGAMLLSTLIGEMTINGKKLSLFVQRTFTILSIVLGAVSLIFLV
jgi:hypothetical protein